ncbi:unnamed protein product [Orchesella dallaii]|uniref:Uncharacterized protein n=1 Tax=Orchesella dallaii TaxID=48710 RepID=A0ABP1Q6M9_9HEXA
MFLQTSQSHLSEGRKGLHAPMVQMLLYTTVNGVGVEGFLLGFGFGGGGTAVEVEDEEALVVDTDFERRLSLIVGIKGRVWVNENTKDGENSLEAKAMGRSVPSTYFVNKTAPNPFEDASALIPIFLLGWKWERIGLDESRFLMVVKALSQFALR